MVFDTLGMTTQSSALTRLLVTLSATSTVFSEVYMTEQKTTSESGGSNGNLPLNTGTHLQ